MQKKLFKNVVVKVERNHNRLWITSDRFDNKNLSEEEYKLIEQDSETENFADANGEYLDNGTYTCDIEIEIDENGEVTTQSSDNYKKI